MLHVALTKPFNCFYLCSNFLQNKPLDASDIKNLEEAKEEIRRLRVFASKALQSQDSESLARTGGTMGE